MKKCIKLDFKEIVLKIASTKRSDKTFLLTSKLCPLGDFRLQRDVFETCNKWSKWQDVPVDIKISSPRNCQPLLRGYKHALNHEKFYKIRLQRDFFELVANDRSDKRLLLTSKLCFLGSSAPDLRLYTFIKSRKDVYKVRGQRLKRFFLNLQQMIIMMRPFCWHQNFDPNGLSAPAQGLCLNFFFSIIADFNISSALSWVIQDQWSIANFD